MKLSRLTNSPIFILVGSLVLIAAFSLSVRFIHLEKGFKARHDQYFTQNGDPLMTTLDAYHFMTAVKHKLKGKKERGPGASPLLVVLTAGLQKATKSSLEKTAFFLPPLLAAFMALIYWWWGREFGGAFFWLMAGLIGMGSFYYYMRTCLGRFDTDSLIPFFAYGTAYFAFKFSTVERLRNRCVYLGAALLMSTLFYFWWIPARYVIPLLLLGPYTLSLFFWPCGRTERFAKTGLIVTGLLAALFVFFGFYSFLPENVSSLFDRPIDFIQLAVGGSGSGKPDVGISILELKPATWALYTRSLAGHPVLFILSLAGFVLLIAKNLRLAPLVAPLLLLAAASVLARRFLIFVVPLYAFGLAYVFTWAFHSNAFNRLPVPKTARNLIIIVSAVLAIALNSARAYGTTIEPKLSVYHVGIAQAIKAKAPEDAMVWSWWDNGYFLEYYTERAVIIHGGSQTPERMFIAAFPLAADDPLLARNWMKFFAARGKGGLRRMVLKLKDPARAAAFLKESFSHPERLKATLGKFGLRNEKKWRRYLFPKANVFLYLSNDLVDKTHWWFYFGSARDYTSGGIHPFIKRLFRGRFSIDETKGLLMEGRNRIPISQLYHARFMPRPKLIRRQEFGATSGAAVLWVRDFQIAYVFDQNLHRSLFAQLLLLNPLRPPPGFEPVKFAPFQGGAWQVE
ncbi:MAG: hypothetical protein JRK53_17925 [Deltaproteobacteria bacterium]|nr:hypothetical protein [Deltaproteobacteria bacterium]